MYNYQMTSFERLQEFWKEIYWLKISQTTLMNFNKKWFWNLESFEEQLKSALIQSPILHSDETWVRIDWKTNRVHTVWTKKISYYSAQEKRWKQAMDKMKILEFFTWILVSDHWSSYKIFTNFILHCFCNAHHLRELKWVLENEKKSWPEEMIKLLLEAKKLKEEAQKRWETFLEKEVLDDIHLKFKTIIWNWKIEYEWIKKIIWKRWKQKKSKWLNLLERLLSTH
jgi:transposase